MSLAVTLPAGAARRPAVPNVVLATGLLVIAEAMMFGGLASGYVVLRSQADAWPPAGQPRLPLIATTFSTLLLVLSGVACWWAVAAARSGERRRTARWLSGAFALGLAFLAVQGSEWVSLLRFGVTAASGLHAALFYTIVACHGLHVAGGLVAMGLVLARVRRASGLAERLDGLLAVRLFWTFVVAVWPPLYAMVLAW